ncbi:hypothetical protein BBJ28_00013321 [Nothophytophthora sp. Chile5]|nr:hypothetical protein BBJ28_00013321 [Nothophytophthora sp. Chile5]
MGDLAFNNSEHHVEVEVEVFLSRFGAQDRRKSHTGYFTVANLDASNQKQRVSRELARSEEEQDDLRVLLKAQHRRLLRDEERKLLHLQPLPLSAISGSRL